MAIERTKEHEATHLIAHECDIMMRSLRSIVDAAWTIGVAEEMHAAHTAVSNLKAKAATLHRQFECHN